MNIIFYKRFIESYTKQIYYVLATKKKIQKCEALIRWLRMQVGENLWYYVIIKVKKEKNKYDKKKIKNTKQFISKN